MSASRASREWERSGRVASEISRLAIEVGALKARQAASTRALTRSRVVPVVGSRTASTLA
ncbi:hypothetical protein [Frankia sp. AiPa1]|uniref:hypothetical protein n=1 Tax=Frankia sp. AiPa1 TaxID=573492 RepID=UPI00202B881F|nr:hypothetical protein [Frankia sp. AiPa1]MCL9762738.1 hypothetical protein [Frankia sp. AiPa1]